MVAKTLRMITSKISGLREAAFWLSVFALFSQILALLRDRLLAHHFGTGVELDVYYAAFKVPDLIFVTVASLVSISALIPLFARQEQEPKRLKETAESIFTVFSIAISFFCILAWFSMPLVINTFFTGFSASARAETIFLSRLLLVSPFFLGFSNFFGSIVQYEKRFILYSLSPLLYNLGIIVGIVFLVNPLGVTGVVIGVMFGALLHFSLQAIFVLNSSIRPKFTRKINWPVVRETALLSVPRTLALSVVSFVGFFFVALASKISPGSITVFNLALNLQSVPLSLIGVSFSLAAFPALSISAAKKDTNEIVERISDGLRQIIFWSLPFTALVIVLRAHIVRVVLGSGAFDWSATRLVAACLAIFVASTVFQSIQLFLSRSHYALGKTKWPLLGNLIGGIVSVATALLIIGSPDFFRGLLEIMATVLNVEDLHVGILLLPLSYSFGALVSATILFLALDGQLVQKVWRVISSSVVAGGVTAAIVALGSYFGLWLMDGLFNLDTFIGVFGHGFFAGLLGIVFGAVFLVLSKNRDMKELTERF